VEGTETALAENTVQWADLLEIDVAPVLDDAEAAAVLSKAFGK